MNARLVTAAALLVGAMTAGCFDLAGDEQSFCQSDVCAVYVSSSRGSDIFIKTDTSQGGLGTKDYPFATIGKALEAGHGAPIYVCGEVFQEAVRPGRDTILFGGRDCGGDWAYVPDTPTTLKGPSDEIPLQIAANLDVAVYGFAIVAVDAKSGGVSSIGVVADRDAKLKLSRCLISAGNGAPGEDGQAEANPAADGIAGVSGVDACSEAVTPGGDGPSSACEGASSSGGDGGAGGGEKDKEADGKSGTPGSAMNGGAGETAGELCKDGQNGQDGAPGGPAKDSSPALGRLDATHGFIGIANNDGSAGKPGQGGGGGGGSKGGFGLNRCPSSTKAGGASGGGGGSGGCGGLGGKGGGAGGSSIGLVSLGATLTFEQVTVTTRNGAAGGNGAEGQAGGKGMLGGNGGSAGGLSGLKDACSGGNGGNGGNGGPGGGGRGGHSIGIAYKGSAPDIAGVTVTVGALGKGGTGAGSAGVAADGVVAKTQPF